MSQANPDTEQAQPKTADARGERAIVLYGRELSDLGLLAGPGWARLGQALLAAFAIAP